MSCVVDVLSSLCIMTTAHKCNVLSTWCVNVMCVNVKCVNVMCVNLMCVNVM